MRTWTIITVADMAFWFIVGWLARDAWLRMRHWDWSWRRPQCQRGTCTRRAVTREAWYCREHSAEMAERLGLIDDDGEPPF